MLPYLDYLEAKKRLKLAKETIDMMGGEDECPPMVLGQRDYLELEVEYFRERNGKYNIGLLIGGIISVIIVLLFTHGVINV
jgi:hypothetical protein